MLNLIKKEIDLHSNEKQKNIRLFDNIYFCNYAELSFPNEIIKKIFELTDLTENDISNLSIQVYYIDLKKFKSSIILGKFIAPNKFNNKMIIRINYSKEINFNRYLECLFHEIYHLKQYLFDKENFCNYYFEETKKNGYDNNQFEINAINYAKTMMKNNKEKIKEIKKYIPKIKLFPSLTMDEIDIVFNKPIDIHKERNLIGNIYVLVLSELKSYPNSYENSDFNDISIVLNEDKEYLRKLFIENGGKTAKDLESLREFKEYDSQIYGSNEPIFFINKEHAIKVANFLNDKYLL